MIENILPMQCMETICNWEMNQVIGKQIFILNLTKNI